MLHLQKQHGDRSNAPNVAVLISHGQSNKYLLQTVTAAETARKAGINIFVIGVGSHVNPVEMKGIAGSRDRIKYVWNYKKLLTEYTLKSIYSKICSKSPRY